MAKRKYRSVQVKDVQVSQLLERLGSGRCIVSIDVAKEGFFAAVMDETEQVLVTVKWLHPVQSPEFMSLVAALAVGRTLDTVMEPSGVYGDALRSKLCASGYPVFRVSPKRSHDMAEAYDGVPSWHDAKSAASPSRGAQSQRRGVQAHGTGGGQDDGCSSDRECG